MNRAAARAAIFTKEADYAAFERTLEEAHNILRMSLLKWHSHSSKVGALPFCQQKIILNDKAVPASYFGPPELSSHGRWP